MSLRFDHVIVAGGLPGTRNEPAIKLSMVKIDIQYREIQFRLSWRQKSVRRGLHHDDDDNSKLKSTSVDVNVYSETKEVCTPLCRIYVYMCTRVRVCAAIYIDKTVATATNAKVIFLFYFFLKHSTGRKL